MPKLLPTRQIQGVDGLLRGSKLASRPGVSGKLTFSPCLAPDLDMEGIQIILQIELSI